MMDSVSLSDLHFVLNSCIAFLISDAYGEECPALDAFHTFANPDNMRYFSDRVTEILHAKGWPQDKQPHAIAKAILYEYHSALSRWSGTLRLQLVRIFVARSKVPPLPSVPRASLKQH
jgi:hypothetical protein